MHCCHNCTLRRAHLWFAQTWNSCLLHRAIHGRCTKCRSELCTAQFMDCTNPCFVPSVYISLQSVCLVDNLAQNIFSPTDFNFIAVSSPDLHSSSSSSSLLSSSLPSPSSIIPSSLSLLTDAYHTSNVTNLNISINVENSTNSSVSEEAMYPECGWQSTQENFIRGNFCSHYGENYPEVCRCDNPVRVRFDVEKVGHLLGSRVVHACTCTNVYSRSPGPRK